MLFAKEPKEKELSPIDFDISKLEKISIEIANTTIYYDTEATDENIIVGGKRLRGRVYFETEAENLYLLKLLIAGYNPKFWNVDFNSLDMSYIQNSIIPMYKDFDSAHQVNHVSAVIEDSLHLASSLKVNPTLSYVIAAFHDIGLKNGRKDHNITSAKLVYKDEWINKSFTKDEIKLIAEAVEDHRASSEKLPRSIFGIIVSDADRQIEPDIVIERTIKYSLSSTSGDREQTYHNTIEHLKNKYSDKGYINLLLEEKDKIEKLNKLRYFIENPGLLKENFDRIYNKIMTDKE